MGWRDAVVRAKEPRKLPVVLPPEEVNAVLPGVSGTTGLRASRLYGAGRRLMAGLRLRVKDGDVADNQSVVRNGTGDKDRVTVRPLNVKAPLQRHLPDVKKLHDRDVEEG